TATWPLESDLSSETMGLRCCLMTSGDGSFVVSTEPATAGMKAPAINNIGRSEASRRGDRSAVSMDAKKFVGAGRNRSAAWYVWESESPAEPAWLRFIASSTETGST